MASKTIQFEVDPGDTDAQWIAVDDQDVPLVNHRGSVSVGDTFPKHVLIWWFTGDAGTTIKITGKVGVDTVVSVSSSVPDGEHDGGGRKRFDLTPKKET